MSKRNLDDEILHDDDNCARKKLKTTSGEKLEKFTDWLGAEGFKLFNVSISNKNVASGWGMVADDDISEGDILFTIPRTVLFHQDTCHDLKDVIQKAGRELESGSGWVPLLLCLLHEYGKEGSRWGPYFDMVPDFNHLHLPMMWSRPELEEELQGTSLLSLLDRDLKSLTFEYESIVVPFVGKNPHLFNAERITLENFKRMVSFVMAYSFTEPKKQNDDDDDDDEEEEEEDDVHPPMMVPLADILNHVSDHNAFVKFKPQSLEMVARRKIRRGEEIYNTYGELSNAQLLHMYGYAERPLSALYDTVDVPMNDLYAIFQQKTNDDEDMEKFVTKKWNYLKKLGYVSDDGCFIIGRDGVLTERMMNCALKVMMVDDEEVYKEFVIGGSLRTYDDDDEEEEEDEDAYEYSLLFENIPKLPDEYKMVLNKLAAVQLSKYRRSHEEEEKLVAELEESIQQSMLNRRLESRDDCDDGRCLEDEVKLEREMRVKLYSAYLRLGQMEIFKKLITCTS